MKAALGEFENIPIQENDSNGSFSQHGADGAVNLLAVDDRFDRGKKHAIYLALDILSAECQRIFGRRHRHDGVPPEHCSPETLSKAGDFIADRIQYLGIAKAWNKQAEGGFGRSRRWGCM